MVNTYIESSQDLLYLGLAQDWISPSGPRATSPYTGSSESISADLGIDAMYGPDILGHNHRES